MLVCLFLADMYCKDLFLNILLHLSGLAHTLMVILGLTPVTFLGFPLLCFS